MRFIRSFWGDLSHHNNRHIHEINKIANSKRLNEIVYVWGIENYEFITSLGFETIKMSDNPTQFGEDYLKNTSTFFTHKFEALRRGLMEYDEVIFLDWDCQQIKDIDDIFYTKLKINENKIQFPFYSFPNDYLEIVLREWKDIPENDREYLIRQSESIQSNNFKLNDDNIIPNASFIYCNDYNIIVKLMEMNFRRKDFIFSEETVLMEYVKEVCHTIEDAIKIFEPLVCDAKNNDFFNQKKLNEFISLHIKKDQYFIHE